MELSKYCILRHSQKRLDIAINYIPENPQLGQIAFIYGVRLVYVDGSWRSLTGGNYGTD